MSDEPKKIGRPRKSREFPIAESKKQAAEILGWPPTFVDQCQRAGAPGFEHGRVDLGALIKWLGNKGLSEEDAIDYAPLLKKEQYLEKRGARFVREGKIMDFEKAEYEIRRALGQLLGDMDKIFCNELPPDLKGLSEMEIQGKCLAAIQRLRVGLCAQFDAITQRPEPVDVKPSNDGERGEADSGNLSGLTQDDARN